MKRKIFFVVFSVVAAMCFIGGVVVEAADIGGTVKEQKQKLTEKAGVSGAVSATEFDAKIKAQQELINKAGSSKTLSKDEVKIVQENLNKIKEKKTNVTKDGKMSELEQGNVQNMLDRNNRMITDKKKNPVQPFSRPEITHRFENQQKRIDQGVTSGALTKQEAGTLQENLSKAKAKHAELTKDGKFTAAEEEKMHDMLNKDSKMIDSKKK
jgi:lipopolysaccharide export LptBFGC system permease protein LptF